MQEPVPAEVEKEKMKTVQFKVGGMHCNACEMLISDALIGLDGVIDAQAFHKKGLVEVSFNEDKVDIKKIKDAIKSEGYEVR